MSGDHYNKDAYPPPVPMEPSNVHYSEGPRKPMSRTAVMGIVITSICFVMLFVALFAPWFTIRHDDHDDWDWEDDKPKYKWNSYDYDGDGYGRNEDDEEIKFIYQLDSMDNGKDAGFWGIILGMVCGIAMIVLGNIHLTSALSRKIMTFFRGVTGIILLLPATFLMSCGSKFTGLSIMFSTMGSPDDKNLMICIVPTILFLLGIFLFITAFGIIKHNSLKISSMRGFFHKGSTGGKHTKRFFARFRKYANLLVVFSMLALVTLPLLPIVSGTDKDEGWNDDSVETEHIFLTSGYLLDDMMVDFLGFDFADYLGWVNFAFWFIFSLSLMVLFAAVFMESGFHDTTAYIIGLVGNLVALFLVLALVFKILFIVNVFSDAHKKFASEGLWYGYNYLPLIALIGLIVICILYMIHTIKGSKEHFKIMSGRVEFSIDHGPPQVRATYPESRRREKYPPPPGREPSHGYDDDFKNDYQSVYGEQY